MDRKELDKYLRQLPHGGAGEQGKIWTIAEIDAFYKQYELGKIKPEEAAKTEAEIWRANQEGRIVG